MRKILVVDDKINVQTSIRIGLKREGYDVDVADDALKALMKVKENYYDVLLSDIRMPVINGFVLASRVAESHPGIKIVLMSAYDFNDYRDQYDELNDCPKLSKPFEMKELLNILENFFASEVFATA
jgi:DNA-binding NtrC family response regulator